MIITSSQNPLAKRIGALSEKKYRRLYKEYLVEGVKPVKECIAAGKQILTVICTPQYERLFDEPVVFSESLFGRVSSEKSPQGVMAIVKLPENVIKPPRGRCILLDGLQDSGNVGAVVRTANAAGYDDIYCINCADAFSPKAVRASMSGIFFVNVMSGSAEEVLNAIKGVPVVAADMCGDNVFKFVPPETYCLAIGNEGNGLSKEALSAAEFKISIPMRNSCESLNAAVSAGIAMYQLKIKGDV